MAAVDTIIVGAGVMGTAAAWRLAARGLKVVLLGRFTVVHVHGSSHGASRILRFSYPDPVFVRMAQDAVAEDEE